jgi:lysophospholipase L1-like esterase
MNSSCSAALKKTLCCAGVALSLVGGIAVSQAAEAVSAPPTSNVSSAITPRLLLPPIIYAAPGREVNLYFDNVVLAPPGRHYLFDATCAKGRQQEERWTWTPGENENGDYALTLEVRDSDDKVVAQGKTVVRVAKALAGQGKPLSALIIGDSLTGASVYTDELLKLFATPGNATLKLVGTHKPAGTAEGNVHEGYGGWTFGRFMTQYVPTPQERPNMGSSPFVFLQDGKPVFDFPRYVRERLGGTAPDVITVMLGTNDVFGAKDENLEEITTAILDNAEKLLAGIRAGAPNAIIGLLMTVPPSASQDAFGANYGANQTRWQYRKNQHRLVERLMERFSGREGEKLFIVPTHINLDCVNNYPQLEAPVNARANQKVVRANNGVHPSAEGYRQIADSLYSWLKVSSVE